MSYAPIVLEDKDFKLIMELLAYEKFEQEKYVDFLVQAVEDEESLTDYNAAVAKLDHINELTEQLRYFYRHFKVKGKDE